MTRGKTKSRTANPRLARTARRTSTTERPKALLLRTDREAVRKAALPLDHHLGKGRICGTEKRGYPTPDNRGRESLVVDNSQGFIPLWEPGVTLRWRFRERSMIVFANPKAAKREIETYLAEALVAWGDAAPVGFIKQDEGWDFEVVMNASDDCRGGGCVLAAAFFPGGGQEQFLLYPQLFEQSREEIVETFAHELGHVFGLRHFFAQVSETRWPSEIFGEHAKFSIMNYGELSKLTEIDKEDLRRLYAGTWGGALTEINGTQIRLMQAHHSSGVAPRRRIAADAERQSVLRILNERVLAPGSD